MNIANQIQQASNAVLFVSNVILGPGHGRFSLSVLVAALVLLEPIALFGAFRPLDKLGHAAAREASQAYINQAGAVSEATRLAQEAQVFGVAHAYRARIRTFKNRAARRGYFHQSLTSRLVGSIYQSVIFILIVAGIGGLSVQSYRPGIAGRRVVWCVRRVMDRKCGVQSQRHPGAALFGTPPANPLTGTRRRPAPTAGNECRP